ncbi:MAG: CinA family protein, partial [Candidatus Omnitrophota bacterium]|nr:CinA family protein [Candidatus Omnitrophota bacterium]
DFGLSITGIAGPVRGRTPKVSDGCLRQPASNGAGPTGATTTKPIGMVFIALAKKNKTLCRLFLLSGKRENIRKQSVSEALRLLYAQI